MRSLWLNSNGVRLFAVEDGQGMPIVLLHGGMANHYVSLPLLAALRDSHRVIAPDLRGSGRSVSGARLSFDGLADDVIAWLDLLGIERAVVTGVSSGSGVALRCALRHPERLLGLVLSAPVYAGSERGLTAQQQAIFGAMHAIASRAIDEGVQVLRPLYEGLAPGIREQALATIAEFDAASVVATSHFLASGAQPFGSAGELRALPMPTLLIRGDDPVHPAEVSELYAMNIPHCKALAADTVDVAAAMAEFCAGLPA